MGREVRVRHDQGVFVSAEAEERARGPHETCEETKGIGVKLEAGTRARTRWGCQCNKL